MIIRSLIGALGLLTMFTLNGARAQETFSFESVNLPGHFIRHVFGQGALTTVRTPVELADASFIIRPALNGAFSAVSFESVNFPGHFLRHQDYRIRLHLNDNTALFQNDASFFRRRGLADFTAESFESTNFPNHYIRHQNFELWIALNDGSELLSKDATFRQQPGLAAISPPVANTPAPAPPVPPAANPIATVTADVDVYNVPGGRGVVVGILRAGNTVPLLEPCQDNWCHVQAEVPGGNGWVWGDFLRF